MSKNMPVANYADALEYLGTKDNRPYVHYRRGMRQPGAPRATRVVRVEDGVSIRYHDTDVITYTESGLLLKTDGWRTVTTKARINEALAALDCGKSINVWQDHGVWWLEGRKRNPRHVERMIQTPQSDGSVIWADNPDYDPDVPYWDSLYKVPFFDGVIVGWDGALLNPPTTSQQESELAENKRRQKLIRAYVRKVRDLLESGELPAPSGGDCWICRGIREDVIKDADTDHLLCHIEESYVVPTLIWKIAEYAGSQAMRWYLAGMWRGDGSGDSFKHHTVRGLPGIVGRFLKSRLGIGQ